MTRFDGLATASASIAMYYVALGLFMAIAWTNSRVVQTRDLYAYAEDGSAAAIAPPVSNAEADAILRNNPLVNNMGANWQNRFITWSVNESSLHRIVPRQMSGASFVKEFTRAFTIWRKHCSIAVEFQRIAPRMHQYANIRIGVGVLSPPTAEYGQPLGHSWYPIAGNLTKDGARRYDSLVINSNLTWCTSDEWRYRSMLTIEELREKGLGDGCSNLLSVAIHELGHALGLNHSLNSEDLMFMFYSKQTRPSAVECRAMQRMYGVNEQNLQVITSHNSSFQYNEIRAIQITRERIALERAARQHGKTKTSRFTKTASRPGSPDLAENRTAENRTAGESRRANKRAAENRATDRAERTIAAGESSRSIVVVSEGGGGETEADVELERQREQVRQRNRDIARDMANRTAQDIDYARKELVRLDDMLETRAKRNYCRGVTEQQPTVTVLYCAALRLYDDTLLARRNSTEVHLRTLQHPTDENRAEDNAREVIEANSRYVAAAKAYRQELERARPKSRTKRA